jgi:hypothetical protein
MSASLALRAFDAFSNMTETSAGKNKPKQEEIRKRYYDSCGLSNDPNKEGATLNFCVLTGRNGEGRKNTLKLAHLVPASANVDVLNTLKLSNDKNGVWSLRNVLLLSWNIEFYYDRKKLSFVPHPLLENTYILKLWDKDVRNELIYEDAVDRVEEGDSKIGYYEGRCLQLTMPNGVILIPFKRCLSYQMFVSFASTNLLTDRAPTDFGSDNDDWLSKRTDLLMARKSLEKVIDTEAEESLEEQCE